MTLFFRLLLLHLASPVVAMFSLVPNSSRLCYTYCWTNVPGFDWIRWRNHQTPPWSYREEMPGWVWGQCLIWVSVHMWGAFDESFSEGTLQLPQIMTKYTPEQEDNFDTSLSLTPPAHDHCYCYPTQMWIPSDRLWYWLARLYLCEIYLACYGGRNVVHGFFLCKVSLMPRC